MAENVAGGIAYYIKVKASNIDALAPLRVWDHLKIGSEGQALWVTGFNEEEINSVLVKSIPNATAYYSNGSKLYYINSKLPEQNIPSALWTPILRGIKLQLPDLNHNFFGIEGKIEIKIISSGDFKEDAALLTNVHTLSEYINQAPAVRLKDMKYIFVDENNVLICGSPVLPLTGQTYWQDGLHLIPAGFNFSTHILAQSIENIINPDQDAYVLWHTSGTYTLIPHDMLENLSLASFKLSIQISV